MSDRIPCIVSGCRRTAPAGGLPALDVHREVTGQGHLPDKIPTIQRITNMVDEQKKRDADIQMIMGWDHRVPLQRDVNGRVVCGLPAFVDVSQPPKHGRFNCAGEWREE